MSDPTPTPTSTPTVTPDTNPIVNPVPPVALPPVTAGGTTTEFKLMLVAGLIAAVFGSLIASGVLSSSNTTVDRIVGILSILVTPFGYTISRTAVKVSASRAAAAVARTSVVLLVLAVGVTQVTACSWGQAQPRIAAGADAFLDCESPNIKALLDDLLPFSTKWVADFLSSAHTDVLGDLKTAATPIKTDLGRCLLLTAVAVATTTEASDAAAPRSLAPTAASADAARRIDLRAAAARARTQLGWQQTKTSAGTF